jgi:hypothetical protein
MPENFQHILRVMNTNLKGRDKVCRPTTWPVWRGVGWSVGVSTGESLDPRLCSPLGKCLGIYIAVLAGVCSHVHPPSWLPSGPSHTIDHVLHDRHSWCWSSVRSSSPSLSFSFPLSPSRSVALSLFLSLSLFLCVLFGCLPLPLTTPRSLSVCMCVTHRMRTLPQVLKLVLQDGGN